MEPTPELLVVVPAYNEQASIRKVIVEWIEEIENWTEQFVFLVIDDGSTDATAATLERLKLKYGHRLHVISRENRGHGQTVSKAIRWRVTEAFRMFFK